MAFLQWRLRRHLGGFPLRRVPDGISSTGQIDGKALEHGKPCRKDVARTDEVGMGGVAARQARELRYVSNQRIVLWKCSLR